MIKKLIEARFRGPTDDPSFADPGGSMEYDELSDKVNGMLSQAMKNPGKPVTLPNEKMLTYKKYGEGDGQFFLDGEVLANEYDDAEDQIMDMLDQRYNEQNNLGDLNMNKLEEMIKEKVKQKLISEMKKSNISEELEGRGATIYKRLNAQSSVRNILDKVAGLVAKLPTLQKVDFLVEFMTDKMQVSPEELQTLMSRLRANIKDRASSADAGGEGDSPEGSDAAAADQMS